MRYWVYIHTFPNGKKYVGITTMDSPELRWANGKGYNRQTVYRAIQKYGWNNVTHEVFELGSEEEMCKKEIELIAFYNSDNPDFGYNIDPGGTHATHPEETRRKISEALKGRPHSEEAKKKCLKLRKEKQPGIEENTILRKPEERCLKLIKEKLSLG